MYTFLFRCPTTGHKVQGIVRAPVPDDTSTYETMTCMACSRVHLVNPTSGTLLALIWVVPLGGADRLRQASDGKRAIPCYHRPMLPTARVPDNLPTPTNSFVIFVVLCLFIFGLMAFAKFMQQRERKRRG